MAEKDEAQKAPLLSKPAPEKYAGILEDRPFFTAEVAQKLFDEFDIKQDWTELGNIFYAAIKWRRLAERIAEKYHPDFNKRPPVSTGHKTGGYYFMLLGTVNWVRKEKGFSNDKEALKYCYNHFPYLLVGAHNAGYVPTEDSLYTDLTKAKQAVRKDKLGKSKKHLSEV